MGCCAGNVQHLMTGHRYMRSEAAEDLQGLVTSSNGSPCTIDDPIAIVENITLNPLGYALWFGQAKNFKILQDLMGASTASMEDLLEKQQQSGLEIIMMHGYIDILKQYLPAYLLNCESDLDEIQILKKPLVHIAIKNEHINIVSFIYSYFECVCPPQAFDLNYIDPNTGENSALVACRTCNLAMAIFLNETAEVDFTILNSNNESALQLAVYSKKPPQKLKDFIIYLIESCKVDAAHQYEDILDNLSDPETKDYIRLAFLNLSTHDPSISLPPIHNFSIINLT